MAAAAGAGSCETAGDGPVLSMMSKRLRALRKKYNRILQMEEGKSQGKPINREQEDVLRSKPAVAALIEEYEKLRQPLATALQEELQLALTKHHPPPPVDDPSPSLPHDHLPNNSENDDGDEVSSPAQAKAAIATATATTTTTTTATTTPARGDGEGNGYGEAQVEDLLKLLYFGTLFDVKPHNEFTSIMLTRVHERSSCLTYDYVTDDATDLLAERDLDLLSYLGTLLIARPPNSILSHKNAFNTCLQHANLWLFNSDRPIHPDINISYAELRDRLNKILSSEYFTTTPEMKTLSQQSAVEAAAAAGNYASQILAHDSALQAHVVQTEGTLSHYQQKGEEEKFIAMERSGASTLHAGNQTIPVDEDVPKDDEVESFDPGEDAAVSSPPSEQHNLQQQPFDMDEQEQQNYNQRGDAESKEQQQYAPRRMTGHQNQRGSRGIGRRGVGYMNGRGSGRGSSRGGGGGYQNGRTQYYDAGNYYQPRNYYNPRGRGGRGGGGTVTYSNNSNNHGGTATATAVESVQS